MKSNLNNLLQILVASLFIFSTTVRADAMDDMVALIVGYQTVVITGVGAIIAIMGTIWVIRVAASILFGKSI